MADNIFPVQYFEIEDDGGIYTNKSRCFEIDPAVYTGKKVLALPRCCRKRKGTKDRRRVNDAVNMTDWQASKDRICNMSGKDRIELMRCDFRAGFDG